jgi:hypothetical protein
VVYVIQSGAFVKIGYCERDPIRRLEKLQVGNPITLILLALLEGGREVENSWHLRFDKMRVRGEWFRLEPKLLKALKPHLVDHDEVSRCRPGRVINGRPAYEFYGAQAFMASDNYQEPHA